MKEDWSKGKIAKLPKEGTLSDCNNWRRIAKECLGHRKEIDRCRGNFSSTGAGRLLEEQG